MIQNVNTPMQQIVNLQFWKWQFADENLVI